jgi:hypothetical protein
MRAVALDLARPFHDIERLELLAEIALVDCRAADRLASLLQIRQRETCRHQSPRYALRIEPLLQAFDCVSQDPGVVERQLGQVVDKEQPRITGIATCLEVQPVESHERNVDNGNHAFARITVRTAERAELLQVTGLEPGFLAQLSPGCALQALVNADEASGNCPFAGMRPFVSPDQDDGKPTAADREDRDIDRDGRMGIIICIGHEPILVSFIHYI